MLKVEAIATSIFRKQDCFKRFLCDNLINKLQEGDILAVTTKIVSLAEGCVVNKDSIDKLSLIKKESDFYLGPAAYDCHLTIKEGLLIPSAGIDESNSEEGQYILYPKDPYKSAKEIQNYLCHKFGFSRLGVILTDSHTQPLRRGVSGIALGYFGFNGVEDKIGETDLFGRELQMTQINVVDGLAVAATLMMGEGNESCPLAIIKASVEFSEEDKKKEVRISPHLDIYEPLLKTKNIF